MTSQKNTITFTLFPLISLRFIIASDAVEIRTHSYFALVMWPLHFWARIHPRIFTKVGRCLYFQTGPFYVFLEKSLPL